MTEITAAYRFRIRSGDDTSWQWDFTSQVKSVPVIGGQRVRPLDGRTESTPWIVELVDVDEAVVAALAETSGTYDERYTLLRRKARIDVSFDGAAYETLALGRITEVNVTGATIRVTVYDERIIERSAETWKKSDTTRIWPPNLVSGWYTIPTITEAQTFYITEQANSYGVATLVLRAISTGVVPQHVARAINDDVRPGLSGLAFSEVTGGSFKHLVARIAGVDYPVVAFRWYFNRVVVTDEPVSSVNQMQRLAVYDPADQINAGDTGYLYFGESLVDDEPGRAPTENVPYHVGGEDGITPFQVARSIYDEIGVSYDATQFGSWNTGAPKALLYSPAYAHRLFIRIADGPQNAAKWLSDNIYAPYVAIPAIDNATGKVRPVSLLPPDADTIPDPDDLFEFNGTNCTEPFPTWEHSARDQVTRITYKFDTYQQPQGRGISEFWRTAQVPEDYDDPLDRVIPQEDSISFDHDRIAQFGVHEREYPLVGIHSKQEAERVGSVLSRAVFERFGDGPVRTTIFGLSATADVEVGDWCVINLDSYPSKATRGGKRIVQVLSKGRVRKGWEFEVLDGGPSAQPLDAPSIALEQHPTDSVNTLRATVTGVPTGAGFLIHIARSVSEPDQDSELWREVATGTGNKLVDIGHLPSNTKFWARARSTKAGRIRSSWSTATAGTTATLTAPSGTSDDNETGSTADLSWTNGETAFKVLVRVGTVETILPAGTTSFQATGLSMSTFYTWGVRHVDEFGGQSAEAFDSFTTTGSNPTATAPSRLKILYARNVGTEEVP